MKQEITSSSADIGLFDGLFVDLATSRIAKSKLLSHPFSRKYLEFFLESKWWNQSCLSISETYPTRTIAIETLS